MAFEFPSHLVDPQRPVVQPRIGRDVFIAATAYVGGDVSLGDGCTVMHHVVIRGDVSAIRIGAGCNIQDGAILHTKTGVDLDIAAGVAIGHRAVVHCRRVGQRVLIGIGSIVLDDCEIGEDCLIGAGAVLAPGTIVPAGKVVLGVPGKVVRDTRPEEREYVGFVLENYRLLNGLHSRGTFPNAARSS
jgi:carbonic anhydrase/acetyltransferase-like protein (isoleucine patch superfamily)